MGAGGIPQGVWMLVTGMVDVGWYGMVGVVVVGWMLVTEMMGWMCGVGCHPIRRGKPLCFVTSPLQGRWMG